LEILFYLNLIEEDKLYSSSHNSFLFP